MSSTRKIIRAFLASPGDLQEERKAVRDVVDEFNESWASELGYQVELIGWEETVAASGRPQHLINQDLDRCDLFLGMIWKRWGTPPGHDGEFSSGFEEEFERSIARRDRTGRPEISLFFKDIPDEFIIDPGDGLKKVIEFKEKIIADKKILFQSFSATRDLEPLVRKCVTAYVNRFKDEDEISEPDELQPKRARNGSEAAGDIDKSRASSPLSAEGFEFLENLVGRISQPDSLDALSAGDIARFRLLANTVSKPGNEEMNLGVHDINILFAEHVNGMDLGRREKHYLTRFGFQYLDNENVPLWGWYASLADSRFDPAVVSSFLNVDENEKAGAITVLTAMAIDLPVGDDMINRDKIIDGWFSDESTTKVRTAALGYLAKCGAVGDITVARKEYDRSDYGTSRSALECMVEILIRTGQVKEAQTLVLESQFETLDEELLRSVLSGFDSLEISALHLGLEHRNSDVRLRSMNLLHERGALEVKNADQLTGDSSALVRSEAIKALFDLEVPLSEEEVRKILVPPKKQNKLGLGIIAASDNVGEEIFWQYQIESLKSHSEDELKKRVSLSLIFHDAAYFALVEKFFRKHADELRRNVDDNFGLYFDERIRRMEASFGESPTTQDLVKNTRNLEENFRKTLTRKGLDVLCSAQKVEDLKRVRANLRSGYTGASKLDVQYLKKYGEWIDIPVLANAEGIIPSAILRSMSGNDGLHIEVAKAITSIGKKHSVSDLLSLDMPSAILEAVIYLCAESRFSKISRDALLSLLNHESEGVRKATSILAVRSLPVKQMTPILHEYVVSDNYRYYNVIHWMDLGVSMTRDKARKVAFFFGNQNRY